MTRATLPYIVLLLLSALTTPAQAQDHSARSSGRLSLAFGVDVGGETTLHTDPNGDIGSGSVSFDLDPSPILGLRYTAATSTYVTVAAEIRMTRWRAEDTDDRNTLLDFVVMPAARYVFDVGNLELEPYLGLPLGLTVNIFNDDPLGDVGKGSAGFNIGLLGGFALNTPVGIGAFVEIGWLHHQTFDKSDLARYRLVLNQAALHVGASYAF